MLGCLCVYSALFGAGSALYGRTAQAVLWGTLFVLSAAGLVRIVPRMLRAPQSLPAPTPAP